MKTINVTPTDDAFAGMASALAQNILSCSKQRYKYIVIGELKSYFERFKNDRTDDRKRVYNLTLKSKLDSVEKCLDGLVTSREGFIDLVTYLHDKGYHFDGLFFTK